MQIHYALEPDLSAAEFIDVLQRSTLAERRPVNDQERIHGMLKGANVIVTARDTEQSEHQSLVGVSRAITDGHYCTYLSDLAVDQKYQSKGIGKRLIKETHAAAGSETTLILLAAPKAHSYYEHIGMEQHPSCWIEKTAAPPTGVAHPLHGSAVAARVPDRIEHVGNPSAFDDRDQAARSVETFFDGLSGEYGAAIDRCVPRYSEMIWALFEYLPAACRKPQKILELGCGTGNLTVSIAREFPHSQLTCVDLSASSLDICKTRLPAGTNVQFVHGDMRSLEIEMGSFDLIMSTISIHHLTSQEKQDLAKRCWDWLKPSGVFTYSDQFSGKAKDVYERHMGNWKSYAESKGAAESEWEMWMSHQEESDFHDSLPEQIEWLREAGFTSVDCTWRYLLWTVLQARKPNLA